MRIKILDLRAFAFVTGVALLTISSWASADPPSRVARLGYMTGAVSFSPAGEDDWIQGIQASINRPLTTGDRLWADAGARTEIQIGGAVIRMNARTSVSILNLDDRIAQLQLTQGALNVRVRRFDPDQVFEVDTPNLAFTLRQPGEYRIEVDPEGDATTIVVRRGQGEAYGEGAAYIIDSRQPYRFTGTGLRDYQFADVRVDEFDRWSTDRDRRYDTSISARYVAPDVVGYQDLDANGTWSADATYGNVWYPTRVASGWAPYRDGHWAWIDPWGWTWVDDAPWGFAVSHYGRWANFGGRWGWVPGPVRARAYYAPALVAFVGGSNFSLTIGTGNVGGVAWFPLGPRDVYRPSYAASRGYFENINRSNTMINTTVINNYYNNTNVTNVVYANQQVPGAVVAVPTTAFVQSQPVSRAAVQVSREMAVNRQVAFVPPVAPTERSVRGAAAQGDKPPPRVFERPVVARTAPPAAPVGFAAQQQQLTARPGRPLEDAARKELKPAAATPAPAVRVVAQQAAPQPTTRPPPAGPGRSDERRPPAAPMQGAAPTQATPSAPPSQAMPQRGNAGQPPQREQRGTPPVPPSVPPQVATPAPAAPPPTIARPAPTAQPPEQRGNAEQRGKGEQRGQPVAPPSAPPPVAMPAPSAPPPQVARPAPTAPPPEQRGNAEQRGKGEQRGQPVAPSAPPPAPAMAQPRAAPPQAAPSVPAPQAQEQRGKSEQREQRGQPAALPPPPQRVASPQPQAAPPAPAMQPPPQRSAPPAPPQAAPVAAAAQPPQRGRPEPAPAAAPGSPPQGAKAAPPGQEQKAAAGDPNDKKKDGDELKRGRN